MKPVNITLKPASDFIDALLLCGIVMVLGAACLWAFLGIAPNLLKFVVRVGGGWILLCMIAKGAGGRRR